MLIRAIAATETKTRHSICISTHFTLNTHPIKSHSLANRERATTKLTHTNSKEHIHNALIYDEHMCSRLAEMSKRYLWWSSTFGGLFLSTFCGGGEASLIPLGEGPSTPLSPPPSPSRMVPTKGGVPPCLPSSISIEGPGAGVAVEPTALETPPAAGMTPPGRWRVVRSSQKPHTPRGSVDTRSPTAEPPPSCCRFISSSCHPQEQRQITPPHTQ